MSKILIFAEKPKVALKIATNGRKVFGDFRLNGQILTKDYLAKNEKSLSSAIEKAGCVENEDYIISFAKGHLLELFNAKDYDESYKNWRNIPYQYIPKEFKFKINSNGEYLYKNLSKLMNRSDVSKIYNAGDADREGEFIFRLIYNQCGCKKPVERIWISSQTEDDLIKACKKIEPSSNYDNLGKAGYARSITDWVMGALLTAASTLELSGGKEIINVGRVQTSVLAEICRIEKLNQDFSSKKYYNVLANFKTKNGEEYFGSYDEDFDSEDKAQRFIASLKKGMTDVISYEDNDENVYSPLMYNQTALQMDMSAKFGFSPDETLATTQSLYEAGFVTYPRTASHHIVKGDAGDYERMYREIASVNPLASKHKFNSSNKRIVDDSKVEGHGAIIPTYEVPSMMKLSQKERDLYETVVKRVIAVNFPPAVDNKQKATTNIGGFEFNSTGIKEVSKGWREVYDLKEKDAALPILHKGEEVEILSFETKEIVTKPPKRYTLASILNFMETCGRKMENEEYREQMKGKGLGTDATRSAILKSLEDNHYISLKGKTIYPTDKGMKLIDIFPVEELKSAEYTGALEYDLYKVSRGEEKDTAFLDKVFNLYRLSCEKLKNKTEKVVAADTGDKKVVGKCPNCGSPVVKNEGKFGIFYGCSNYKSGCKFSINKICGKNLTENQATKLLSEGSVGPIKGLKKKDGTLLSEAFFVIKENEETKLKEVGLSFGSTSNNESTDKNEAHETLGTCPSCGGNITKKEGKFGTFYSCSNYKDGCKFTINKICSKTLTETQVKKLLKDKKLIDVKGLKKKDGKELSNVNILLDGSEVKLDFAKK